MCERLAQGRIVDSAVGETRTRDLSITNPTLYATGLPSHASITLIRQSQLLENT